MTSKGFLMFKRRPRSPLAPMSAHELRMLREAVQMTLRWERAIPYRAESYPDWFEAKSVVGLSGISVFGKFLATALERAKARLAQRPDFGVVQANRSEARLRKDSPAAYQVLMLRRELRAGSATTDSIEGVLRELQRVL